MQSAGNRVRGYRDWFWFYFLLDNEVARVFLSKSYSDAELIIFRQSNKIRSDEIVTNNC